MNLRYGIPSYKRPECMTAKMLLHAGVNPNDIYISLQDASQLAEYKANYRTVNFIVNEADCAAGNRNTLMDAVGFPIVLMDDDLSSIAIKRAGENFKSSYAKDEFEEVFLKAIKVAVENGCSLVGGAANTNDIIAKNRREYDFDTVLQGSLMIVLDDLRFDESFKAIDDYELSLRVIAKNGHTMRMNKVSACKRSNCTNKGGCYEVYKKHPPEEWIKKLATKYSFFKPNKTYTGGSVVWR